MFFLQEHFSSSKQNKKEKNHFGQCKSRVCKLLSARFGENAPFFSLTTCVCGTAGKKGNVLKRIFLLFGTGKFVKTVSVGC